MEESNVYGNLSTLLKFVVLIVAPYVAVYGVDGSTLYSVLSALLGLVLAVVDAWYPNTLRVFGNAEAVEAVDGDDAVSDDGE